nr:unnamed protein product [Digitaria exilis]
MFFGAQTPAPSTPCGVGHGRASARTGAGSRDLLRPCTPAHRRAAPVTGHSRVREVLLAVLVHARMPPGPWPAARARRCSPTCARPPVDARACPRKRASSCPPTAARVHACRRARACTPSLTRLQSRRRCRSSRGQCHSPPSPISTLLPMIPLARDEFLLPARSKRHPRSVFIVPGGGVVWILEVGARVR